jgi:hypothetical protein
MRARRCWRLVGALALLTATGCQAARGPRSIAATEPGLELGTTEGSAVVEAPPARTVSFVDRHPLLYRPREYYQGSSTSKVGRVAAATFIGVPVGFVGELKQIVNGQSQSRY